MKKKIKKGDTVKVISGSYKGSVGKVIEVLPQTDRLRIEGSSGAIAPIKRHIKPQKNPRHPEGGIIEAIGSIHISNVMLVSESLGRPVRTGTVSTTANEKQRVARGRNLKAEVV
jgi:large subunit ribosomal protein L24